MSNANLQDTPMPAYSYRLVSKILLIVGFIIVGCVALLNFFFLDHIAAPQIRQIKEMARTTSVVVSDLALSSFYSRDKTQIIDALDKVLIETGGHESGLQQISVILYPSGIYYASTNREFQNKKAGQTLLRKIEKNAGRETFSELLNYEVNNRTTTVLQFLKNIYVNQDGEDKRIASVQVLFDYNRILRTSRLTLFLIGALILLLCLGLVCIIFLPVSAVYRKLFEGLQEVGHSHFNFSLPVTTRDETGILFRAFNRMNQNLQAYFKEGQATKIERLQEGEEAAAGPGEHLLRKTEITCLCARIPGIQEMIEKSVSSAVDEYISEFLEPFEKTVQEYGGQVVKVLGDKVYTLFEGINSIDNSVRMALKINQSWQISNHERKVLNRKQKNFGIGLHSTEGVAGSLSRMTASYTFVGDAAAVAERLCSCAKMEEILISASMMDKTSGAYQHQVVKTISAEDLTMKEDVISITPLPVDDMGVGVRVKAGPAPMGGLTDQGGDSVTGQSKSSFESSITDMLEETLISSPLDPLNDQGERHSNNDDFGGFGLTGEPFDDSSQSLWETFNTIKKDEDKE